MVINCYSIGINDCILVIDKEKVITYMSGSFLKYL